MFDISVAQDVTSRLTPSTALWVMGMLIMPGIGWAIWLTNILVGLRRQQTESMKCHVELLNMHKNADEFGFGTVGLKAAQDKASSRTDRLIEDNTRAMHALTHYIVWFIKETSGKAPPPPMPIDLGDSIT